MKMLLFAGVLMVVLGIASLVVPIPRSDTQGIKIGETNIGVQTSCQGRTKSRPQERKESRPLRLS